jgi:hypothetical protein
MSTLVGLTVFKLFIHIPRNGACCAANGQFKAAGTICGAKTFVSFLIYIR